MKIPSFIESHAISKPPKMGFFLSFKDHISNCFMSWVQFSSQRMNGDVQYQAQWQQFNLWVNYSFHYLFIYLLVFSLLQCEM